jgi:hypothetical protein
MKRSILLSALGVWILVLLLHGSAWSQQVSQDMIDRETTRLEMQIKSLENQKMGTRIGDSAASERYERSIDHVKDRLRLLRDDPDQYFYNRQQQGGGRQYMPPTTTPTPAEPTPQRTLQGPDGFYYPDGPGGYVGPRGRTLR